MPVEVYRWSLESSQSQTRVTRGQQRLKRKSSNDNIGQTEVTGGQQRSTDATRVERSHLKVKQGSSEASRSWTRITRGLQNSTKGHQRPTAVKQRFPAALRGQTEVTGVNSGKERLSEARRDKSDVTRASDVKHMLLKANKDQTDISVGQKRSQRSPDVIRSQGQRSQRGSPRPT
jgi:hypothetical protein